MSLNAILFLVITLSILIGLLFALMVSYYFLLKRMSVLFPTYYKQLGSPFLPTASWAIAKTIGRDTANYALLQHLFVGLPTDFPDDARLRNLVRQVRLEMLASLLVIGVGIGIAVRL